MSKPTCDHENTTTPYCANCGEKLTTARGSPQSLLAHLRIQRTKAERELERSQNISESARHRSEYIHSAEKVLAKWTGWIEFVEAALKGVGK